MTDKKVVKKVAKKRTLKTKNEENYDSNTNNTQDPNQHPNQYYTNYQQWYQQPPNQYQTPNYYPPRKLYRSTRDKWLGGVCGGIAEYYNKDPLMVRLLWILLTVVSAGVGIVGYLAFWFLVDKHPAYNMQSTHYHVQTPQGKVHYNYHGYNNQY